MYLRLSSVNDDGMGGITTYMNGNVCRLKVDVEFERIVGYYWFECD